jgi:hypothetical protein
MPATPTLAQLRALAEAQGVTPTEEVLEGVRAFLEVLVPAFEEMERLIPPGTPPAGPEVE